jgi:anti-sigma-K factor RskA
MTHEEYQDIATLDAIGAASEEEQRTLSAHLDECAECRRVREEYMETAAALARQLDPATPPPDVRERILAAIGPDDHDEVERRFLMSPWWLATAAILFLALWGWREIGIRVARERIQSHRAEIEQLSQANAFLALQKERLATSVAALASPDTRMIQLAGQQISPNASARVFLRPGERRAIVFFHNLPRNPGDKSYQLWIIPANQPKPQSAGVFDVTEGGDASITIENLPVETEIKGLAVTLEPRGGVEQPTNTSFFLMGSA